MAKTSDAVEILNKRIGSDEATRLRMAQIHVDFEVAQMIYDARMRARLSQAALAELIGTKQSVIARLEDADYRGHSLTMLQRIATALHQRVEVRFVNEQKSKTRRRKAA